MNLKIANIIVIVLLTIGCLFAVMTWMNTNECQPLCDQYLEANCPFLEDMKTDSLFNVEIE